jgi:hypothetical protein
MGHPKGGLAYTSLGEGNEFLTVSDESFMCLAPHDGYQSGARRRPGRTVGGAGL